VKVRVSIDPAKAADRRVRTDYHAVADPASCADHRIRGYADAAAQGDAALENGCGVNAGQRTWLRVEEWKQNGESAVDIADDDPRKVCPYALRELL
jgi:hypothetical protein